MASAFKYTHAVVSRIPNSLATATNNVDLEEAKKQHETYVRILRELGLDVIELPPDEQLPMCVFVEDTAVVCNGTALIARPGDPDRVKEIETIRVVLKKELDLPIIEISDSSARLDGGDVLFTGKEFFVGISQWTNEGGARSVAAAFPEYPCTPIKVPSSKHLKALISMAGPDLLCVGAGKECQEVLKRMEREATFSYQTLTLPEDDAANVLFLNGTLVHRSIDEIPSSFKIVSRPYLDQSPVERSSMATQKTEGNSENLPHAQDTKLRHIIEVATTLNVIGNKVDFPRRSINISELGKASSGLSSSCILIKRMRHIRNL